MSMNPADDLTVEQFCLISELVQPVHDLMHAWFQSTIKTETGAWFDIKMSSYQYRDSNY